MLLINVTVSVSVIFIIAGEYRVEDAAISFGGMNKVPVCAPQAEAFLKGKTWNRDILAGAYDCLCNVR